MNIDTIPLGILFLSTIVLLVITIEAGYRLGLYIHKSSNDNKELSVSAISGSILGLLAFILAFTFSIVSNRYDDRRALVIEDTNAISTAYLRANVLPEADRKIAMDLLQEYTEIRLAASESRDYSKVYEAIARSEEIHKQLWSIAVENAYRDMNSPVTALFMESLNVVFDIHTKRVSTGVRARIPTGIWMVLFCLVLLSMFSVGFQISALNAKRSITSFIMAISFSVVIILIATLDRPNNNLIPISYKAMEELSNTMSNSSELK